MNRMVVKPKVSSDGILHLALPVGLGFLTALFSKDRRGLHDRFAGTRVVRALA